MEPFPSSAFKVLI
ncbi:hypothetical protein LINPERHAP2_LOCUS20449 [Linum perenne]